MKYTLALALAVTALAAPHEKRQSGSMSGASASMSGAAMSGSMSMMSMSMMSMSGGSMMPTGTMSGSMMPSATMSGSMPSGSSGAPTDIQILQYALTLENLEAAFYKQGLDMFDEAAFEAAGFPPWVRGRAAEIGQHEQIHANLLAAALGSMAVAPCNYSFPLTDPKTFMVFACGLENIGTSAYIGAAQYITTPSYLPLAGSILSVEARHQGWINSAVFHLQPWTGPFDTPLGLDMVFTLASQAITSCPTSNAMLPVKAYPALTVGGSPIFNANAGDTIMFDTLGEANGTSSALYAAFYNGLGSTSVAMNGMSVTVPDGLQGYSYVLVTSATNVTMVDSTNIVAGPAEMQSPFNSQASNPGFMNPFGV